MLINSILINITCTPEASVDALLIRAQEDQARIERAEEQRVIAFFTLNQTKAIETLEKIRSILVDIMHKAIELECVNKIAKSSVDIAIEHLNNIPSSYIHERHSPDEGCTKHDKKIAEITTYINNYKQEVIKLFIVTSIYRQNITSFTGLADPTHYNNDDIPWESHMYLRNNLIHEIWNIKNDYIQARFNLIEEFRESLVSYMQSACKANSEYVAAYKNYSIKYKKYKKHNFKSKQTIDLCSDIFNAKESINSKPTVLILNDNTKIDDIIVNKALNKHSDLLNNTEYIPTPSMSICQKMANWCCNITQYLKSNKPQTSEEITLLD